MLMAVNDNLKIMVGEVKVVEVAIKGKSSTILYTHAAHNFALLLIAIIMTSKGNMLS